MQKDPMNRLLKELKSGKVYPVYLLYGQDEFRIEETIIGLAEAILGKENRELNLENIYVDKKTEIGDIIERARDLPFLSRFRVIILRDIDRLTKPQLNILCSYLKDPVATTCMILTTKRGQIDKALKELVALKGVIFHFPRLNERQLISWIRAKAKELGISISGDAVQLLYQIVGEDTMDLFSELQKLSMGFECKKEITSEDIKRVAFQSRIYGIFELMDAVSERDLKKSSMILRRYMEIQGPKDGALIIIGMLNRQVKLLLQVKDILEKKGEAGREEISEILGAARFTLNKIIRQSQLWDKEELYLALRLLYRADERLKSGHSPYNHIIEDLIISLCHPKWMY